MTKLLIALFLNVVLLCLSSLFAATGSGGDQYVKQVLLVGGIWVAVLFFISMRLYLTEREVAGIALAFATLPLGYIATILFFIFSHFWQILRPGEKEFVIHCQSAGAQYVATPSSPVRSLAYNWAAGKFPPSINYFRIDERGNMSDAHGGTGGFKPPSQIEFVESRCCRFEGIRTNKGEEYFRSTETGNASIAELTADALVKFEQKELRGESGLKVRQQDILVTDRRDGKLLASLRYFVDEQHKRACGTTGVGVMDERAFVYRAIGIGP